jgi:hypothetical protein
MLAHGFKIELLIDLARAGLATTSTERMLPQQATNGGHPSVPIRLPTVNTTTTTCQINGDTRAMTCQNSCTPTTAPAVANPAAPTGGSAYSLGCTTQQLVSKQRC